MEKKMGSIQRPAGKIREDYYIAPDKERRWLGKSLNGVSRLIHDRVDDHGLNT
jgi:hypothetical protein